MVYLDEDYKIDCENKIKYDRLVEISTDDSAVAPYIFNADRIYTDQDPENPIYLVQASSNTFYTKNVKFCKEIGNRLFKVSIHPYVASKAIANRQTRILSGN